MTRQTFATLRTMTIMPNLPVNMATPSIFTDMFDTFGPNIDPKQGILWQDDFLGDAVDAQWVPLHGSDSPAADPAISAQAMGAARFTTGDSNVSFAECGSQLSTELIWKPSLGPIIMEVRFTNSSAITARSICVGLTDTKALEAPFSIATTTVTAVADDAVAFVYDTAATNAYWHTQGVKATTKTAIANSGIAPAAAATWQTLRIELDTSGNATFSINGSEVATVSNAVTATTTLAATVSLDTRATASKLMDVDFIRVLQVINRSGA